MFLSSGNRQLPQPSRVQSGRNPAPRARRPFDLSPELVPAIDAAKASGAEALNVLASPFLRANERTIIDRTAAIKLPAIYQFPELAEDGGLAGYGPRVDKVYRDLQAPLLVKLLNGTKPSDLPAEQPTKFELVINLKTAKALGVAVPAMLLDRADKVIE